MFSNQLLTPLNETYRKVSHFFFNPYLLQRMGGGGHKEKVVSKSWVVDSTSIRIRSFHWTGTKLSLLVNRQAFVQVIAKDFNVRSYVGNFLIERKANPSIRLFSEKERDTPQKVNYLYFTFPEHLAKQTDFVRNKETVVRLKAEYHDLVDGMELGQQVQN